MQNERRELCRVYLIPGRDGRMLLLHEFPSCRQIVSSNIMYVDAKILEFTTVVIMVPKRLGDVYVTGNHARRINLTNKTCHTRPLIIQFFKYK